MGSVGEISEGVDEALYEEVARLERACLLTWC